MSALDYFPNVPLQYPYLTYHVLRLLYILQHFSHQHQATISYPKQVTENHL
jgi:hypothetical protein